MNTTERTLSAILSVITGVFGMILFFGECDSILLTVLTKPVGIGLLMIAAKLYDIAISRPPGMSNTTSTRRG